MNQDETDIPMSDSIGPPPALRAALATLSSAEAQDARNGLRRLMEAMPGDALEALLAGNPRRMSALVSLFAGSAFLSEVLLRHPEYIEQLDPRSLVEEKGVPEFTRQASGALTAAPDEPLDALRRYQRAELLRIGTCDLLGLRDLAHITRQLSGLAEGLVRAALFHTAQNTGTDPTGLVVLALGKLGGAELNYSSDIDLVLVARDEPERYQHLAQSLVDTLASITAEGFLYRVDLRLRPWGQVGPLISSLAGYLAYVQQHARLWERQALLKARTVAGDAALGSELLARVTPLLFTASQDDIRADIRAMKGLIESELRRRGREWGEVKLGVGSIRDIEFTVQYLQLIHGCEHPDVLTGSTLDALERLGARGLLPPEDQRVLADGYRFLRPAEHYLQLVHHQQTHSLPTDAGQMDALARRLGFGGSAAGAEFLQRYQQHSVAIRRVYRHYLELEEASPMTTVLPPDHAANIQQHLARMAPSYAAAFSSAEIEHHAVMLSELNGERLVAVEASANDDDTWRVTIVGQDYPGELSLICGLLYVYGLSVTEGHVFTYERPLAPAADANSSPAAPEAQSSADEAPRKIVDVFTVRPTQQRLEEATWSTYAEDLGRLFRQLRAGQAHAAHGQLAKRVALTVPKAPEGSALLLPIEIVVDNVSSDRYTILHIDAPDTVGFLYEFTVALALSDVDIAEVVVQSQGERVQDTLYLTDMRGAKIATPEKERALRAATVLVKHFTHLLPHSPNPESALLHFREFLAQLFALPNWSAELGSLERPEVLAALARLLGVSDFLWDDFLRMQYTNLYPIVREVAALEEPRSKEALQAELAEALQRTRDVSKQREVLNEFKDAQMFRVDMRHIQGHIREFGQFSAELTTVAEVVMEAAYRLGYDEMVGRYGDPLLADGQLCPMCVCALGKFGGYELGYASDIELMFVYGGNGNTNGRRGVATSEFYDELVSAVMRTVYAKREGIFQLDIRLRPYGEAGSLAVSLDAFQRYYALDGAAWPYERQALVKLRPVAGDAALGQRLVDLRDQLVYNGDWFDVTAMRAMRERQLRHLVAGGSLNAKFSDGGLVDAEYLVQTLQIRYGGRYPSVRLTNTCAAMDALALAGLLAPEDHVQLRQAYIFIRRLIDALRIVRGNARDLAVPPFESEAFAFLARRLDYGADVERMRRDLTRFVGCVHALSARLL